MSKKLIIKACIALVIIVAASVATVVVMKLMSAPQRTVTSENSDEHKSPSADDIYKQAEEALKTNDLVKAKDLFQKAKDSYSKNPDDKASEKLADIESHLQTIKLKEQGPPITDSTKMPLVKSGQ